MLKNEKTCLKQIVQLSFERDPFLVQLKDYDYFREILGYSEYLTDKVISLLY